MTIYLDFDGTVVEHEYPVIGEQNPYCFEVLSKLLKAGHKLILNTKRVEFMDGSLEEAIRYIKQELAKMDACFAGGLELEHTSEKIDPLDWNWEIHMANDTVYVDDTCHGAPMRDSINQLGQMVDWQAMDVQFEERGLY